MKGANSSELCRLSIPVFNLSLCLSRSAVALDELAKQAQELGMGYDESPQETAYLLRSPANARRLAKAMLELKKFSRLASPSARGAA